MNIVLPDGSNKELAKGATVADVAASIGAGLAKAALAGIVNDRPVDLSAPMAEGDSVAIVTAKSDEGLELLRHSTAHVMAAALVDLYGDVQFVVGPAIEGGFYYAVKTGRALSPDDFAAIEARMAEIVKSDEPFERRVAIRPIEELRCRYYLRLTAARADDALPAVADTLEAFKIAVAEARQVVDGSERSVIAITEEAREGDVQAACAELAKLASIERVASLIRIEDTAAWAEGAEANE